jgi:hypothetical protein
LCGPNIPLYLIRGIGMLKLSDKYPSIVKNRDELIEEYRQCKTTLLKMKDRFQPFIYVYTSIDKKSKTKSRLQLTSEEAYKFSYIRQMLLKEPKTLQVPVLDKNEKEFDPKTKKELTYEERIEKAINNSLG